MCDVNNTLEQQLIDCIENKIENQLQNSVCEDVLRILKNIDQEAEEIKKSIWEGVIRRYNPEILREQLKLEFVLQSKYGEKEQKYHEEEVLVIAHMFYPKLFSICVDYLCQIPVKVDKCITTSDSKKREEIEELCRSKKLKNFKIQVVENCGREISALLVGCRKTIKNYKYLCFIHDKATSGNMGTPKIGSSFMYLLWDNLLKSAIYIRNVLNFMESHPYIGILVPPAPYHADYFGNYGNEWTGCYEETQKLAKMLKLKCKMSKDIPPYTLGTAFWCRVEALNVLWDYDWGYDFFPKEPLPMDNSANHAIERIFEYVAQHEGYATGIVMNEEFASIQLSNYQFILNGLLKKKRETASFLKYKDYIDKDFYYSFANLHYLVNNFEKIFIYGTGFFAKEITEHLKKYQVNVEGYVVSDGYRREIEYYNRPVYEVSEIVNSPSMLLIIALKKQDFEKVLPTLQKKEICNLYYNGQVISLAKLKDK